MKSQQIIRRPEFTDARNIHIYPVTVCKVNAKKLQFYSKRQR